MSNTRTVKSPGVFAADASTTIPPTPSVGVAYRDVTTTTAETQAGWPYATKVASETFNQIMHEMSALLSIMDTQGILGWTNAVDYGVKAYVLGSDGELYRSLAASGPSTAPQDPTTASAYWVRFGAIAATASEVLAGIVADKFISPATLKSGFPANLAVTGHQVYPSGLIENWGIAGPFSSEGALRQTFDMAFPNAFLNGSATIINPDGSINHDQGAQVYAPDVNGMSVYLAVYGGGTFTWPVYAYWRALGR